MNLDDFYLTNARIITNLNCAMQHKEMLMNNQFFDQKMFNNFDNPLQKLMELNVKMMQNLSLMKPMDLLSFKNPEEFFDRNMELFIQNSNMTLNYMRETFNILERNWLGMSRNMDHNVKKAMDEASSSLRSGTKRGTAPTSAVKKATTAAKKTVSAAKKAASSSKKGATASKNSSAKKAAAPAAKQTSSLAKKSAAPASKKVSSSAKTGSTKKHTQGANAHNKKLSTPKEKQEAKKPESKPTTMGTKAPMGQNAPMSQNAATNNMHTEHNMPKVSSMSDKSGGVKDIGMNR